MSIELKSDFDVDLIQHSGSDQMICWAARVSVQGAASFETEESAGLINFLMENRHGSPFEHGLLTFRIKAPIFVWREFMRHRIGFSYNEQSGRYMELSPVFYIPTPNRPLVQQGKAGHYTFVKGSTEQYDELVAEDISSFQFSWNAYQSKLKLGVAKEVARNNLPVAIYSSAYVTCNPRSLMSFLSLRTKHVDSVYPSYPQWEINQVANKMEVFFSEKFPITHNAFHTAGRVSP